jgi:hypothetical protein
MKLFNKIRSWFKSHHNQLPIIESKTNVVVKKITTTEPVNIKNIDNADAKKQDNITTTSIRKTSKSQNKKTTTKTKISNR